VNALRSCRRAEHKPPNVRYCIYSFVVPLQNLGPVFFWTGYHHCVTRHANGWATNRRRDQAPQASWVRPSSMVRAKRMFARSPPNKPHRPSSQRRTRLEPVIGWLQDPLSSLRSGACREGCRAEPGAGSTRRSARIALSGLSSLLVTSNWWRQSHSQMPVRTR
jgi:hypothetical protein